MGLVQVLDPKLLYMVGLTVPSWDGPLVFLKGERDLFDSLLTSPYMTSGPARCF